MRLIKELYNSDVNEVDSISDREYRERSAARAVLLDDQNNIALIDATNINIHKILGGGIEDNEEIELALEREIMEESGCAAEVIGEIGTIIEHRTNRNFKQINHCFLARLVGGKGKPEFTDKEVEEGFGLIWVNIDEAEKLFDNDNPTQYSAKFQQKRDRIFLSEAKKAIEKL